MNTLPHIDYDQIATEYARHRQIHPGVFYALYEAMRPHFRVLEVGCGTGNYVIALQAQLGCTCWGVDPSPAMLAQAQARSETIIFRQDSAERLDLDAASFDLAFSVDVIHHISDRQTYYCQAHRVLDTGGRICTATDSEWILRHRQPLSTYFPETVEHELARYPRIAALKEMMAQAGFDGIGEHTVECTYSLTDIQIYRDKAFSALHVISETAFRRGIARMEYDLQNGPIVCTPRYTLLWGTKA